MASTPGRDTWVRAALLALCFGALKLVSLRFVMNGLARRVLRSIDDLSAATRQATDITAPIGAVMKALAEYRRRNEAELYALYELMDPRAATPAKCARSARK